MLCNCIVWDHLLVSDLLHDSRRNAVFIISLQCFKELKISKHSQWRAPVIFNYPSRSPRVRFPFRCYPLHNTNSFHDLEHVQEIKSQILTYQFISKRFVEGPFINKVYKENNSYFAPRKDIQNTPILQYNKSNIWPLNSQGALHITNMIHIPFACEEKHCQSGYKI